MIKELFEQIKRHEGQGLDGSWGCATCHENAKIGYELSKSFEKDLLSSFTAGLKESAEIGLNNVWLELGTGFISRVYAEAYLAAFVQLEIISEIEYTGWLDRFQRCPGHNFQSWCAYCGDVENE